MSIIHFLITIGLFVLLTPGILLRLPQKGSKWKVAIVHGIVFAVVMHIVYWYILPNFPIEGFKEGDHENKTKPTTKKIENYDNNDKKKKIIEGNENDKTNTNSKKRENYDNNDKKKKIIEGNQHNDNKRHSTTKPIKG